MQLAICRQTEWLRATHPVVQGAIHSFAYIVGACVHTSGEAAFPRPRLGQVLTPLGVNIIALARTVITDYVKLNCYIYQSEKHHRLFGCVANRFGRWVLPFLEQ